MSLLQLNIRKNGALKIRGLRGNVALRVHGNSTCGTGFGFLGKGPLR